MPISWSIRPISRLIAGLMKLTRRYWKQIQKLMSLIKKEMSMNFRNKPRKHTHLKPKMLSRSKRIKRRHSARHLLHRIMPSECQNSSDLAFSWVSRPLMKNRAKRRVNSHERGLTSQVSKGGANRGSSRLRTLMKTSDSDDVEVKRNLRIVKVSFSNNLSTKIQN